jgi:hypothetical protein
MKLLNEFIWKFKFVFNRYIFRTLFSNKIISTPINFNSNISYEGIWKHRKYKCDIVKSTFLSLLSLLIVSTRIDGSDQCDSKDVCNINKSSWEGKIVIKKTTLNKNQRLWVFCTRRTIMGFLHETHYYGFFARDVSDMSYQRGSEIMASLLPVVTHMQKLSY